MDISVVIPTRNRAERLRAMLAGLRDQRLSAADRFEAIVVDNGSTDDTPKVVADAAEAFSALRCVSEPVPGLHAGRHAGLRAAEGEILVFCDDDIVPEPGWLAAMADSFAIRSVALAGGPCRPDYEAPPPEWIEGMKHRTDSGWLLGPLSLIELDEIPRYVPPEWIFGCNYGVRREAVLAGGGFRPDSMPPELIEYRGDGETGLAQAIAAAGGRAYYNPEAAVRHWVGADRMTPDYIYRRGFAEGVTTSFRFVREARGLPEYPEIAPLPPLPFPDDPPVLAREARGRLDGFWFHQRRLRQNPLLPFWVLRASFLGHEAIGDPPR